MSDKLFKNPYLGLPKDATSRINVNVSSEDFEFLRRIRVYGGTITTTISVLFNKLIHELKSRNIVDYTSVKDFEHFVATCRIVPDDRLPGSAPRGPTPQTPTGHDPVRADRLDHQATLAPYVTTDAEIAADRKGRKGNKKGKVSA